MVWIKLIIVLLGLVLIVGVDLFVKKYLTGKLYRLGIKKTHGVLLKKLMTVISVLLVFVLIVSVWSVNPAEIWKYVAGFIGLVAIGLFAVWSILSNVLIGVVLMTNKAIKIGDTIEIVSESVKGTVKDMGFLYVTLEHKKKHVYIPNNIFIQKIITCTGG